MRAEKPGAPGRQSSMRGPNFTETNPGVDRGGCGGGTDHGRRGASDEEQLAKALAERWRLPYYSLAGFHVDSEFFKTIPVELMYRYPFVPYEDREGVLTIVLADPTNLPLLDELELVLRRELRFGIGSRTAILDSLKKSEGSSQVPRRIAADFRPVLIKEDDRGEEVLSVEKISKDASPVVKLVDTTILSALQKRASDIHVEEIGRGSCR